MHRPHRRARRCIEYLFNPSYTFILAPSTASTTFLKPLFNNSRQRRCASTLSISHYSFHDQRSSAYMTNGDPKFRKSQDKVGSHEWEELILEFEQRAIESQYYDEDEASNNIKNIPQRLPPTDRPTYRENPDRLKYLPIVESAMMAAFTGVMWFFGRILQLDSLFMFLYPFPMIFSAMRWGLKIGDLVLQITLVEVVVTMGPLFAVLYMLNSGILGWVFCRALWWYWPWWGVVFAGAVGKAVGLTGQFFISSLLLQMNSWKLLTQETHGILMKVGNFVCGLLKAGEFNGPTPKQVRIGVAVIVTLYSAVHVLSTYLITTMILDRLSYRLKRAPRLMPILQWAKERSIAYHAARREKKDFIDQ